MATSLRTPCHSGGTVPDLHRFLYQSFRNLQFSEYIPTFPFFKLYDSSGLLSIYPTLKRYSFFAYLKTSIYLGIVRTKENRRDIYPRRSFPVFLIISPVQFPKPLFVLHNLFCGAPPPADCSILPGQALPWSGLSCRQYESVFRPAPGTPSTSAAGTALPGFFIFPDTAHCVSCYQ